MTREEIEAELADGTLVRGATQRWAHGTGEVPAQGALLLPEQVERVAPPVRGREVLGWLVVGEESHSIAAQIHWSAPVVGVARRV
jgi:hypothetical protein